MRVAEDVRVPVDHLVAEPREQVSHRELTALGADLGVKHHLKEHIAEAPRTPVDVTGLDRLEDFVRFFDQVGLERRPRLLAIPGTTRRSAQTVHDVQEPLEENTGGLGHVRAWRSSHYTVRGLRGRQSSPTREGRRDRRASRGRPDDRAPGSMVTLSDVGG